MAFTAADVKNLREMTGVGMLDCKKALAETDGDMDKAVEYLGEKGLAAAQKKAGRIAAEGIAYAEVFEGGAALVEVNSETDFVAKNDKFVEFVKGVAATVAACKPADLDAFLATAYAGTEMTVSDKLVEMVAQIGEKIKEHVTFLVFHHRPALLHQTLLLLGQRHHADALATGEYGLQHLFRRMGDEDEQSIHRRFLHHLQKPVGRLLIHLFRQIEYDSLVSVINR